MPISNRFNSMGLYVSTQALSDCHCALLLIEIEGGGGEGGQFDGKRLGV